MARRPKDGASDGDGGSAPKPRRKKKAATKTGKKKTTGKAATKKPAGKASGTKAATSRAPRKGKKTAPPPGAPSATPIDAPDRRGQLAAERSRFELGGHEAVLREALGELPPGYGLTVIRGLIRDPRHLVLAWDINEPRHVERLEALGWERVEIRVTAPDGTPVTTVGVGRRAGTHHVALPEAGLTVEVALGMVHPDGFFETIARSATVRLPPDAPPGDGAAELVEVPADVDRRRLVDAEPPPRPGLPPRRPGSPAARLAARLGRAVRSLPGGRPGAAPRVRTVGQGAQGGAAGVPAGSVAGEGGVGDGSAPGGSARTGGPSSADLARPAGRPPTSPGRHEFGSR
ncbi:MAG: DUF4912 domain-containing protein [Acidobacteria bacterium]|nr:MAG: DUF4912 domain-containing protein [Acidobacteriota bacterium]